MSFAQDVTCLIFPFRWAGFPIKIGRNAQWEHLFSMDFDDFSSIYLIFLILTRTLLYKNVNLTYFILKLLAKSHQNIKRFIQIKVHFRW